MSIRFTAHGIPAPQGSKIRTKWGMREASKNLQPWREAIVSQIIRDGLNDTMLDGPLTVRAVFMFPRPAAHYGSRKGEKYLKDNAPQFKPTAPDLDKLCRSLGDALTQSGLITDDDRIVRWETEKRYCNGPERPGVFVEVMYAQVWR